jgi:hypothetical protein
MSQEMKTGQNGASLQKDKKPTDEQRTPKAPRDQSKADKPADTGSASNSMPGSGSG